MDEEGLSYMCVCVRDGDAQTDVKAATHPTLDAVQSIPERQGTGEKEVGTGGFSLACPGQRADGEWRCKKAVLRHPHGHWRLLL